MNKFILTNQTDVVESQKIFIFLNRIPKKKNQKHKVIKRLAHQLNKTNQISI